jgi:predicted  nucleic acid-binding Zn-ribbon protein
MGLTEKLVALYAVDAQVRGLRRRLDTAHRHRDVQDRHLEQLRQQRAELEARTRQLRATVANLETEAATVDARLEKLRNELNGATTNKQYTAVLTELNTVKVARQALDDQQLQQMERIEQNSELLAKLAADTAEREKVRGLADRELNERQNEVGARLAELEAERQAATASIPAAEMRLFNELADMYDGEAMAEIQEIDRRRREYACGACHVHLPFQAISVLLGKGDVAVRCTACRRILYLHEETRGALAKK